MSLGVGVVGYGYWGPNLARNAYESNGTRLLAVADRREERRSLAATRFPGIETCVEMDELLAIPELDAVAIATPTSSHYPLAMAALEAGKHVWVEKPCASTTEEAAGMVREAESRGLTLLVDHTFVYNPAVREIRRQIDSGGLGNLYYYDSVRVNLGLFQHDVNVLWDLAVHDLSIMDYLIDTRPTAVSCTGMAHLPGKPENVAYLTCLFGDRLIAHVHVNWLAPAKIRRMLIGGDRQMIVYDDLEPSEKVKIYDRGVTVDGSSGDPYELLVGYRTGDMRSPHLSRDEALRVEMEHFAQCIATGETPLTDGRCGWRILKLLEAADLSLAERGRPVDLDWTL